MLNIFRLILIETWSEQSNRSLKTSLTKREQMLKYFNLFFDEVMVTEIKPLYKTLKATGQRLQFEA